MSSEEEKQALYESLSRDLDIRFDSQDFGLREKSKEVLSKFLHLSVDKMTPQIFWDLTLFSAGLGQWEHSLSWVQRAMPFFSGKDFEALKLWEMRINLELGRASEAIALAGAYGVPKFLVKEFHYLMGEAFLHLKMYTKARQRFEAVFKVDAKYRDVEIQMKSLALKK